MILCLTRNDLTGVCVNGLARGIRNKPITFRPLGYMYGAFIGLGLGIWADNVRERQAEFNNKRVQKLLASRESRQE